MISYQRLLSSNLITALFLSMNFYLHCVNGRLTAIIRYEYYSSSSNYSSRIEENQINGIVSSQGNQKLIHRGSAFTLIDSNGRHDGCQSPTDQANYSNGIAILHRGGNCTFSIKITRAEQYGAKGIFYE